MIKSKNEYKYYLDCDKVALLGNRKPPFALFGISEKAIIWKYMRLLRRLEYLQNCKRKGLFWLITKIRYNRLSNKYGLSIAINAFGPGLCIVHLGRIIINENVKAGENCRIQTGVTLGATNGSGKAPQLGNNIFLAEGCKLFGDITIADDVQIGANAVVVKSITEPGTTWGGVPAKKISNNSSAANLGRKATEIVGKRREM